MHHVGVLAYGSLITEPGWELDDVTDRRVDDVPTPFRVEFARASNGRGGAPTLVPVDVGGAEVRATILVLRTGTSLTEARNITYRREIGRIGDSERLYVHKESPGKDDVVLRVLNDFTGIDRVIYTDICATIPVSKRTGFHLAGLAIESVAKAGPCKDGITYLRNALSAGITTPLSDEYRKEVLRMTNAATLEKALIAASSRAT